MIAGRRLAARDEDDERGADQAGEREQLPGRERSTASSPHVRRRVACEASALASVEVSELIVEARVQLGSIAGVAAAAATSDGATSAAR